MNLVFVIKSLTIAGGGAERVLSQVASGLAARGHQVRIVSYDSPGGTPFYDFGPGVERIDLGIGRPEDHATLSETVRRIHRLRRVLTRLRPDVAIGFMHSIYIPLGLALVGTGIPVVASEHIVYDHYRTRPLEAALLRLTPRISAAATVLSERVRGTYPPAIGRHMTVVPNPVSAFAASGDAGGAGGRKVLLCVGRLEAQKDHATLVAAFAALAPSFPDWDLRIVGEGELRPQLEADIAARGLGERISLPGTIGDIAGEYRAARLFAIPSLYESFGLVTAEALAHGLPTVGFADCPGTNELIVDRVNGLLVEGGGDRAAALAEGLASLMSSEDLRNAMARAAPASVSSFSLDSVLDHWETLLRSVSHASAGR